jgi:F-type H+-transporting ATPase subunit alpha
VEEQVVSIFAGTKGYLDDIPTEEVGRFESELLEEFRSRYTDLLGSIKESGKLPDEQKLKDAIENFKERFQPAESGASSKKADDDEESGGEKSGNEKSGDEKDEK